MCWTIKKQFKIGHEVIKVRSAFFPVNIGSTTIWLEFYKKKQYIREKYNWKLRKLSY